MPKDTIDRLNKLMLSNDEFRQIHHFENETIESHIKYLKCLTTQQYQNIESNNHIVALRLACLESLEELHSRKTAISSCVAKYKFNEKLE